MNTGGGMDVRNRRHLISGILVVLAIGLIWPIYHSPVWWVSLEAPNYPVEAFPDGVRILFHFNGVFSGCQLKDQDSMLEQEALDCAHEMDTINHYVGMYPIASGGPVELFFSLFLVVLVGVLLAVSLSGRSLVRTALMAVGFTVIVTWMGLSFYGQDGLKHHSARYLAGRITALGESADEDQGETEMTPGEALIARLKASLAESEQTEPEPSGEPDEKQASIDYLKNAFEQDRSRMSTAGQKWRGNGSQLLAWHYEKSLGRYFRDELVLAPMVAGMTRAGSVVFWGIVALMAMLMVVARKPGGLFDRMLVLVPAGLPLFFIIEYSTWLWWYGHNMNEMGAFTLKAFMPTVFGQGKVAQFTTNSYPAYGFWLMVLFSALLVASVLLKREPAAEEDDE
jgi:hypothetical protein